MASTSLQETIEFWNQLIEYADVMQKQTTGAEDVTWTAPNGETGKSFLGYVREFFEVFGHLPRFKTVEALKKNDADFAAGIEGAIELKDGSFAFVADDTDVNNGVYIKEGGDWVKSKYDPLRVSKEYTDSKLKLGKNIFHGEYLENVIFRGIATGGYDSILNTAPTDGGMTAIVEIKPNTTYTISKTESDRFRVAVSKTLPVLGNSVPLKVLFTDDAALEFTFTSGDEDIYAALYLTSSGNPPEFVQMEEGDARTPWETYGHKIADEIVEIESTSPYDYIDSLIEKGVNIFNGEYLDNYSLYGGESQGDNDYGGMLRLSTGSSTALIEIKPNTTYTISKTESSRFRVGLSKNDPRDSPNKVRLILTDFYDDLLEYTFTSGPEDTHLLVYVAIGISPKLPDFMQVEEGNEATKLMTYGYKFKNPAVPYYDEKFSGRVGVDSNANYIERGDNLVYTGSDKSTIAKDNTDELQAIFDKGGIVSLEADRLYNISRTINIDLSRVREVQGNGATLVITEDVPAIEIVGRVGSSANPQPYDHERMMATGRKVHGLRITSSSGLIGTAALIRQTFMLDFNCECYFLKEGIVVGGRNRNIHLTPRVYAVAGNSLRFTPDCNLHQGQINISDMSYSNKILYFDDATIYNVQVTGGGMEVNKHLLPAGDYVNPHSIIHIRAENNIFYNVMFTGIDFEDHFQAERIVKIESSQMGLANTIQFSGCFFGSPSGSVFELSNVQGLKIEGVFSVFSNYGFDIVGDVTGLKADVSMMGVANGLVKGGGIIKSVGNHTIKDVMLDVQLTDTRTNAVDLQCNIDGFMLSNCMLSMLNTSRYITTKGFINIDCTDKSVANVHIKDNLFKLASSVDDIVKVKGEPTGRVVVTNNESTESGAYPAKGDNLVCEGNYP